MGSVILKGLSTENFASFADRTYFTTKADIVKKEYLENTFSQGDDVFNKVSFLYGANGSGKTFFCKMLIEIQRLLALSPMTAVNNARLLSLPQFKGIDAPVATFAFDVAYNDKPTFFGIDIVMDNITYHYEFAIKNKKVMSELLTKKYRRTEKLLVRTSASYKDITLHSEFKEFEAMKQVVKEEALCLPMAAFLNIPLAVEINESIKGINVLNMTAPRIDPVTSKESFSFERITKYVDVLRKADSTLRKMKISFEEEETGRQKIELDGFENREIMAMKATVNLETEHAVFDKGVEISSAPIDFFSDESLGTVKLFTVLPHLYDILENGGILILDEVENGLHLSLVKELIQLFISSESNPKGAQLICTSHQPLLVEGNVRRDQVWIMSKDNYGKCTLQRMSDLSTSRAKVNLAKRLMEGALGCNPNRFFTENNT